MHAHVCVSVWCMLVYVCCERVELEAVGAGDVKEARYTP